VSKVSTFFGLKIELPILLPMLHTSFPTPATFSRRCPSKSPVFFLFLGLPINSVSLVACSSSSSFSSCCFSGGTDLSLFTLLVLVAEDEDNEEPGVLVDVGVGETLHLCLEVTLPSPLLFLLAVEESREVMSVTVKLVVLPVLLSLCTLGLCASRSVTVNSFLELVVIFVDGE